MKSMVALNDKTRKIYSCAPCTANGERYRGNVPPLVMVEHRRKVNLSRIEGGPLAAFRIYAREDLYRHFFRPQARTFGDIDVMDKGGPGFPFASYLPGKNDAHP